MTGIEALERDIAARGFAPRQAAEMRPLAEQAGSLADLGSVAAAISDAVTADSLKEWASIRSRNERAEV